MMKGFVVAGVIVALGAGAVFAQGDVIAQRQAAMKAMGDGNRAPAAMLRGDQAFNLATIQAQLKVIEASATNALKLFPDNSKTGDDTAALPKIWEAKADFDGKLRKLAEDARAAQAKITDEASFKQEFPALLKNCGGCHNDFRARRS